MPPPLFVPMISPAFAAVMSGSPIDAKSPAIRASNEDDGTSVHCFHEKATFVSACWFVSIPRLPRSVKTRTVPL